MSTFDERLREIEERAQRGRQRREPAWVFMDRDWLLGQVKQMRAAVNTREGLVRDRTWLRTEVMRQRAALKTNRIAFEIVLNGLPKPRGWPADRHPLETPCRASLKEIAAALELAEGQNDESHGRAAADEEGRARAGNP